MTYLHHQQKVYEFLNSATIYINSLDFFFRFFTRFIHSKSSAPFLCKVNKVFSHPLAA